MLKFTKAKTRSISEWIRIDKTRRLLAYFAIGGMLGAAWVSGTPSAAASAGSYLQALNDRGLSITDTAGMIKTGMVVCTALNDATGDVIVKQLVGKVGYSVNEATIILVSAVEELCPWHDHRDEALTRKLSSPVTAPAGAVGGRVGVSQ
jgi:hypothetical protein